jgi:hypothetical protein
MLIVMATPTYADELRTLRKGAIIAASRDILKNVISYLNNNDQQTVLRLIQRNHMGKTTRAGTDRLGPTHGYGGPWAAPGKPLKIPVKVRVLGKATAAAPGFNARRNYRDGAKR